MPIVSQTFEEKVEVLKQDTRDCVVRIEAEFEEWAARQTRTLLYADVVQFLRLTVPKSFSAQEVIHELTAEPLGRGALKLLLRATLTVDVQQLVQRWVELPTWGQDGPELDVWA